MDLKDYMSVSQVLSDDELVKTKDVLEKGNITRQMFYTYLNLGLIQPAKTLENGHRLFYPDVFRKLACIQLLRDKNYVLRDIKDTWKGLTDIISVDE
jgi:DNA-binding transcriptional MerR regulator